MHDVCRQCGVSLAPDRVRMCHKWRNKICTSCYRQYHRERYHHRKPEYLQRMKAARKLLKERVVEGYGGRCVCCGETQIEFLTLDHIVPVRRQRTGQNGTCGHSLYQKLLREGFPKDNIQLLCYNC